MIQDAKIVVQASYLAYRRLPSWNAKSQPEGPAPVGFFEEERAFCLHLGLSNSYAKTRQTYNNIDSLLFNAFSRTTRGTISPNHAIITPHSAVTDVVIEPGLIYSHASA
jgi:hypothetical protein